MPSEPVSRAVTWGLLAAWAVHDAEELIAYPRWPRRARPRLERRLPHVPDAVWRVLSPGQAHATLAIGIMGGFIAAAAAAGARSGGRSPVYQAVLTGFGAHAAVPHLASAALTGGYTPGLYTTPTVVVPFSVWAWRELRKSGVEQARIPPAAAALGPLLAIGVAHAGAAGILHTVRRLRARQATADR